MIERGAARRRLRTFAGAISRGGGRRRWSITPPGPSVCVGVGVSRTRKWVLLHSIIHRACARGLPPCWPPLPVHRDHRGGWRPSSRFQGGGEGRYKCGRVYDKSPVNTTGKMLILPVGDFSCSREDFSHPFDQHLRSPFSSFFSNESNFSFSSFGIFVRRRKADLSNEGKISGVERSLRKIIFLRERRITLFQRNFLRRISNETTLQLKGTIESLQRTRIQNTIRCGRYSWFKSRWKGREEKRGWKVFREIGTRVRGERRKQSERIRSGGYLRSYRQPITFVEPENGSVFQVGGASVWPSNYKSDDNPLAVSFSVSVSPPRASLSGQTDGWKERNRGESWGLLSSYITVWVTPLVFA